MINNHTKNKTKLFFDQQQTTTNDKQRQTTNNDKQRQTTNNDKQRPMTNNDQRQTPTNDKHHPDGPSSCKRLSGWIGLLQMIIRLDRPLANDHPDGPASCK